MRLGGNLCTSLQAPHHQMLNGVSQRKLEFFLELPIFESRIFDSKTGPNAQLSQYLA